MSALDTLNDFYLNPKELASVGGILRASIGTRRGWSTSMCILPFTPSNDIFGTTQNPSVVRREETRLSAISFCARRRFNRLKLYTPQAEGRQIKERSGILQLLFVPPGAAAFFSRPGGTLSTRRHVSPRPSGCPSLARPALLIATGQLGISVSFSSPSAGVEL